MLHSGASQRLNVARGKAYFLAGAAPDEVPPELRIDLKKSEDGSSTITSLFLLKLAL